MSLKNQIRIIKSPCKGKIKERGYDEAVEWNFRELWSFQALWLLREKSDELQNLLQLVVLGWQHGVLNFFVDCMRRSSILMD